MEFNYKKYISKELSELMILSTSINERRDLAEKYEVSLDTVNALVKRQRSMQKKYDGLMIDLIRVAIKNNQASIKRRIELDRIYAEAAA